MALANLTPAPLANSRVRIPLEVLFGVLGVVVLGQAMTRSGGSVIAVLAAIFLVVLFVGMRRGPGQDPEQGTAALPGTLAWIAALSVLWFAASLQDTAALYLVFPLYLLVLWTLPGRIALPWTGGLVAMSVASVLMTQDFTAAGLIGPLVGYLVALTIGGGYLALQREATRREEVIAELRATQELLATAERRTGALAERARLARDIHDTTAQGLTSIMMLLHAAEATDPDSPAMANIRLARQTAADELAEARRVIHELTPSSLDGSSLPAALEQLSAGRSDPGPGQHRADADLTVRFELVGEPRTLPLPVEAALLRVAQGSLANVQQHAGATEAIITLSYDPDAVQLTVKDNGRGLPVSGTDVTGAATQGGFGLTAMRQRAAEFSGRLEVGSAPGSGTVVTMQIPVPS